MNNVEKAFTHRLYCPRKRLVKQAIDAAFPGAIVAQQSTYIPSGAHSPVRRCMCNRNSLELEPIRRELSYGLGASAPSGACSP